MEHTDIASRIEECVNNLYTATNNEDIKVINETLSNFISIDNFQYLKMLMYKSSFSNVKFYAANALTNLITENYLTIELSEKIEMYDNLLSYIHNNSEDLFLNTRFLLNILITLLCRIIRISWLQSEKFKEILDDAQASKEDNYFTMIIPFLIYSELIYQFQLPDIPPRNKMYRLISDFKETALFCIYEGATNMLINIFKQEIKFEKIDHCILFINEISNCISECMEYEEDLNAKSENYKKYEIKPIYVPSNKKKTKDRTLNIDSLNLICKSLFETHNIIAKLAQDNSIPSNYQIDKCLCLLQKYCSIKLVYLGDYKGHFLRNLQFGITNLIQTKIGLDNDKNLEEFCKLIFLLKKNFTVSELLDNIVFIEQVYKFSLECIQYYPLSIPGLVYLIRFFGYFSTILAAHPVPNKEDLKKLILELVSILFQKVFSEIDSGNCDDLIDDSTLFIDLVDSVALLSRGIFINVTVLISEYLDTIGSSLDVANPNSITKMIFIIYFATAIISFNQRLIIEKSFMQKVIDDEENNLNIASMSVNDSMISVESESEEKTECQVVCEVLARIFKTVDYYQNKIKILSGDNVVRLNKLESGIFYFLKNFCKLFLSKNLSAKYSNIFYVLTDSLSLDDSTMLLNFIISFLIEICKINQIKSDHRMYQNVIKIFNMITNNAYIDLDTNTGDKILNIGKLLIGENFLKSLLEFTGILVKLDPVSLGKYRSLFYKSLMKIILLKTNINNDELFSNIINYYVENIALQINKTENEAYMTLGYMKDLRGISSAITLKEDYKKFITLVIRSLVYLKDFHRGSCYVSEVNISMLKLLEDISNNRNERVYFPSNSPIPIQLLNIAFEVTQSYRSTITNKVLSSTEEYTKHIKPVSLILKIFKNFFIGRYIHFGSLVSVNPQLLENILFTLCEIMFSVKLENILNYLRKLNVSYSIIKIIFCEYSNFISKDKFSCFLPFVIRLLEEGVESLDNIVLITTHQIIFEWGKTLINMKTKNSSENNNEIVSYIFNVYEENFQKILHKIFKNILLGEITSLNEMSNSLFVLILIYNTFYLNMSNSLILTTFNNQPNKQDKIKLAFDNLFNDVRSTLDDYNLNKFQRKLKDFSNEIQGIV